MIYSVLVQFHNAQTNNNRILIVFAFTVQVYTHLLIGFTLSFDLVVNDRQSRPWRLGNVARKLFLGASLMSPMKYSVLACAK